MAREYPIERTRDIGIIAHIDPALKFALTLRVGFALCKFSDGAGAGK